MGSVGTLARGSLGITRPARGVGAAQVGREIGTKMSEEKLCATVEGLSCERFSPKGSWSPPQHSCWTVLVQNLQPPGFPFAT